MSSEIEDGWGDDPSCGRRMQRRLAKEKRRGRRQLEGRRAALARAREAVEAARQPLPSHPGRFVAYVSAAILAGAAGAIAAIAYRAIAPALLLGVTAHILVAVAFARRSEARAKWAVSLARCEAALEKAERDLVEVHELIDKRRRRFDRLLDKERRGRRPDPGE